jgi:hypothetical protein
MVGDEKEGMIKEGANAEQEEKEIQILIAVKKRTGKEGIPEIEFLDIKTEPQGALSVGEILNILQGMQQVVLGLRFPR